MFIAVLLIAMLAAQAPAVEAPQARVHYVGTSCRIEFDVPSGWVVTEAKPEPAYNERCAVEVRPRDLAKRMEKDDVDRYTIRVSVPAGGSFLSAADEYFAFRKGRWITEGRQGLEDGAEVVNYGVWSGLRGSATVGCFHEGGGYAGLCDSPRAVLEDDFENVWIIEGGGWSYPAFDMILHTFKFASDRPR